MIQLSALGVSAVWDPECGHLPHLVVNGVDLLHRAPWRDDPEVQADRSIPKVDRRLGGTFVCAPFGLDDVGLGPPHGMPANAPWTLRRASPSGLTASRALPMGTLTAQIGLRDHHPVLYQTHILDTTTPCTFAHHPMLNLREGGRIFTNALKVMSFDAPSKDGTALYLPGQQTGGTTLQTIRGERDWRDYPADSCDDFLTLIHAPGLAWTAVARHGEGDTILSLKQGAQLPMTGLWLSNGARTEAPWNGRAGVLGVEDGRFAGADGFAAAVSGQTRVPGPTCFAPGCHVIPHALVRLEGAAEVGSVALKDSELIVQTQNGARHIPFDGAHFA